MLSASTETLVGYRTISVPSATLTLTCAGVATLFRADPANESVERIPGREVLVRRLFLVPFFAALAVATLSAGQAQTPDVILFGVTGDGAEVPETIYTIDPETADTHFFAELGNGDDGEEIAYNANRGLILHASGFAGDMNVDRILEWVDPETGVVTPLTVDGAPSYDEVSALAYAGNGSFIFGDLDSLWLLSEDREVSVIGEFGPFGNNAWLTGLAFVGSSLYGVVNGQDVLVTIDPSTGETLSSQRIDSGFEGIRPTALATHPCSDDLYGVFGLGGREQPSARLLVSIDPDTAEATAVGNLDDAFAGITFAGDCPSTSEDEHGAALITISKQTIGGLATEFDFSSDFAGSFTLAHGESKSGHAAAGTYEVVEAPISSFELAAVECDGGETGEISQGVRITVEGGEAVECVFYNGRPDITGIFEGMFTGPPPTATPVPPQETSGSAPTIRPPSTGSGGLFPSD